MVNKDLHRHNAVLRRFIWNTECVKIKRPNTKTAISQKFLNIFAPNFLVCSTHNWPQISCLMPYLGLLDLRHNDGNLNLKNKFCN